MVTAFVGTCSGRGCYDGQASMNRGRDLISIQLEVGGVCMCVYAAASRHPACTFLGDGATS